MFAYVIFLVFMTSVSATDDADALNVSGTTFFGRWLSFILSRGMYGVIVTLLTVCFIISAMKNKMNELLSHQSDNTFVLDGTANPSGNQKGLFSETSHNEEVEAIKERLREAEIAMQALKSELEQANKSKIDLETTIENIERDKTLSEDELVRVRMAGNLEVENLKNDSATVERQLQIAVKEKEELLRDLEALKREARISEWALKDQRTMSERLEAAQVEIKDLRAHLKGLRVERDAAVRLASDLLERAKGVAHRSAHQRQLIEEMIDSELKRVREEEEEEEEREGTSAEASTPSTRYKHTINDPNEDEISQLDVGGGETMICDSASNKNCSSLHIASVGDAPISICQNLMTETDNDCVQFITDSTLTIDCNVLDCPSTTDTVSMDDDDDDATDPERPHMVTGSPAFRAFLRNVLLEES